MANQPTFRRLILGFQPPASDPALELAAELARRLHLDLVGLFPEDRDLLGFAALPFAREIRPFGGTWHAIAIDDLARELELASRRAERRFNELVRGLQTSAQFEILSGSLAQAIDTISRTGDVVAIIEPVRPADRFAHQFAAACQAAFRSAAAVLILPARVARQVGPVVALAAGPDDACVPAAATIAAALGEKTVLVSTARGAAAEASLRRVGEQLIVVSRGTLDDEALSLLAARRSVPVLVIDGRS